MHINLRQVLIASLLPFIRIVDYILSKLHPEIYSTRNGF